MKRLSDLALLAALLWTGVWDARALLEAMAEGCSRRDAATLSAVTVVYLAVLVVVARGWEEQFDELKKEKRDGR